jgi:hypothetical protein
MFTLHIIKAILLNFYTALQITRLHAKVQQTKVAFKFNFYTLHMTSFNYIVIIICITSTNLVNDRKIMNIHLSTPFTQNFLEDSDNLWYWISTLEVVEVHIRQSTKS